MAYLQAVQGDITTQAVDAIVNPANTRMRGGGGVDGAIHRAAGGRLLDECISRFPDGLKTGEAGWTHGFNLPAQFVIHTPGPVYRGKKTDRSLLESSYRNCLAVADELGVDSIAFPLISTGTYGYPIDEAIDVALEILATTPTGVSHIRFVTLDAKIQKELKARFSYFTWLRLLQGVGTLHQRGYEGVRIRPGMSPSGMFWRVQIASSEDFEPVHWKGATDFVPKGDANQVKYTTAKGTEVGTGYVTSATSPDEAADIVLQQVPTLAKKYSDPEYVVWFQALLAVVEGLKSAPILYSDYYYEGGPLWIGGKVHFPSQPTPLHLRS